MTFRIFTLTERPDLREAIFADAFGPPLWPEFMLHDPAAGLHFSAPSFDRHLGFAFAALDDDKVVGRAYAVPFAYDIEGRRALPDGGWDEIIRWAHEDQALGRKPDALSALEITLLPEARGKGHAREMLEAMKAAARTHGLAALYAPVRPTRKSDEPTMAIADYVAQCGLDGLPRDPWLRTHVRAGGTIVKICPYAMTIVGTLEDWSAWTGMTFTRSGEIVVEGALSPVHVSREQNHAVYIEPGVWVHHRL